MTTRIHEGEYDKKINVTGQKFSCDAADDSIPHPLPRRGGFGMLLVGKPGAGKTSLILSLLCKQGKGFNKKFDKVFIFSPSLITMEEDPFEMIPSNQKFECASLENLTDVLSTIKDSGEKILIVLDDCISDIRGKGRGEVESILEKIFFNRRHLCGSGGSCSIMATSQTYNKISPKLRKTASHIIFYKNLHKKELDSIFEEMILIPKKEFYDTCQFIYKKKHDFMFIDTTQEPQKMLHRNFCPLTITSPNISTNFEFES